MELNKAKLESATLLVPSHIWPFKRLCGAEIVTDTVWIVNRLQALDVPDLSGDATTQAWLKDIEAKETCELCNWQAKRVAQTALVTQVGSRHACRWGMARLEPVLTQSPYLSRSRSSFGSM